MGDLSDELVIDFERFGIVAKYRGKTYFPQGAKTGSNSGAYLYALPECEKVFGDVNFVYLMFKDGNVHALGTTLGIDEIPKECVDSLDFFEAFAQPVLLTDRLRIDPQMLSVLRESLPESQHPVDGLRKALGDLMGLLCRTDFYE